MLRKTHKSSTAKGLGPCESNFEAMASSQRNRVRQLKLTTTLLKRLANSNPIVSSLSSITPSSPPLKLIDITKVPLTNHHPTLTSLSNQSATSPSTTTPPNMCLELDPSPIHPSLISTSDCLVAPLGPSVPCDSVSPLDADCSPILTSTPFLPSTTSSTPSLVPSLSSSGPLVASSTSRLLEPLLHPSTGPLVASPTSRLLDPLLHPSSGPLVASSTSRLLVSLPHLSAIPLEAPIASCLSSSPYTSPSLSDTLLALASSPESIPSPANVAQLHAAAPIPLSSSALRKGDSQTDISPLSASELKLILLANRIKDDWFPGRRIEKLYEPGLSRFIVKPSRACKRGSLNLGLFLKEGELPLSLSMILGYYTGRISSGKGPYHLDLTKFKDGLIIDGSPNSDHPMTCFGRINDDIYDGSPNVKFGKDGSIIVIRTIFPGDEILIEYGTDYDGEWDWIRQESFSDLASCIKTRFPFVTDLPDSLEGLHTSKSPLSLAIKNIIYSTAWTEHMHSTVLDPEAHDILALVLYISSGITYETYRFGGWGSGKTFPTVSAKRGQSGFFCDSWNGVSIAPISPATLLDPGRKNNGPIRNLLTTLRSHYGAPSLPPPSQ